jgi:ribosomal protein S19
MTRSLKKGFFFPYFFFKTKFKTLVKEDKLTLMSRGVRILDSFIGHNIFVYNGKKFVSLNVSSESTRHKFGEFSTTRVPFVHKRKKHKKDKKKNKMLVLKNKAKKASKKIKKN